MCGIFAVLGLTGDPALNRQRVYKLAKRIRHRGPDSYSLDVHVDDDAGAQWYMPVSYTHLTLPTTPYV